MSPLKLSPEGAKLALLTLTNQTQRVVEIKSRMWPRNEMQRNPGTKCFFFFLLQECDLGVIRRDE